MCAAHRVYFGTDPDPAKHTLTDAASIVIVYLSGDGINWKLSIYIYLIVLCRQASSFLFQ